MNRVEFIAIFAVMLFSFSGLAYAQTSNVPDRPINLLADDISPTKIDLSWDAPSNDGGSAITGYKIEVSINSGNYFTLMKNTDTATRTFVHTDREPDTTYTYRVYAINSVGTSGSSNEASATPTVSSLPTSSGTAPSAPKNLEVILVTPSQVNL